MNRGNDQEYFYNQNRGASFRHFRADTARLRGEEKEKVLMKRFVTTHLPLLLIFAVLFSPLRAAENYKNFKVAVYVRAQEVEEMKNLEWLAERWSALEKQVHVDKVYLETFRDRLMPGEEAVSKAKQFFGGKGIKTAGGIATVRNERNHFQSFCYSMRGRPAKTQGDRGIHRPAF